MQRPYGNTRGRAVGLYLLLGLYIAVTLTYQIVASVSLIVGYFDLRRQVQAPFEVDWQKPLVTTVTDEAKRAGLHAGDTILSLDGEPYHGRALWQRQRWYAHVGDVWQVSVRHADGTQATAAIPLSGFRKPANTGRWLNGPPVGEAIFIVFMQIVVPLFCLGLGYWVALARPQDANAWLILILLSYPEAFISVGTINWWPGIWLPLRLIWHISLEAIAPAALLFLGLLFPERSRIDIRFPWFKWLILATMLCSLGASITTEYAAWYHFAFVPDATAVDDISTKVVNWTSLVCIIIYWVAILDKLRTASTADARRRLRVLCAGSVVGLGSVLVIFVVLPIFGIADPNRSQWLGYLSAVLMLAFPLSLAYVVVVQRAMEVRILLRMGTKYALARGTIWILRTVLLLLIGIFFWQMARAPHLGAAAIIRLVVLTALVILISPRIFEPVSRWIDRRFFREAYNADLVLSELSEQVRHFTETVPLMETVSRRISDVLHVPEVSVLLRGDDGFQLCHSSSRMPGSKLGLAEQSTAVRRVVETNRPAMVYQKSAEGWLLQAEPQERHMLEQLQAEVLLPLPGRQRLMGVMVLGRKKSEEPYSVSDLRVLQSVGVQTGLALEVSELAHSLAQEASQRARMNREMEIARDVQQRFFPRQMPVIAGLDLAGACRPALGVGGDYYDVIELGDGRVGLAIGDVSGKGISAALLMAGLRACLRTLTLLIESANSNEKPQRTNLARLMQDMNRLVYEASEVNRYATFFFGIYDCPARTLHYVNAGHNAPMLLKASGIGSPVRLETGGSVIGLLPHVPYSEAVLTFEKGDLLLTYTDGISEAMTADDEEWGEERMFLTAERLRHAAAADVLRGLFAAADEFTGTAPQYDDMTLLVLKVN